MANQGQQLTISEPLATFDASTIQNPSFEAAGQFVSSFKSYQQPYNKFSLQTLESKDMLSNNQAQINQQIDIQYKFLQKETKDMKRKQDELQNQALNEPNPQIVQEYKNNANGLAKQMNHIKGFLQNQQKVHPDLVTLKDLIAYLVKQTQQGGGGFSGENIQNCIQTEKLTQLLFEIFNQKAH